MDQNRVKIRVSEVPGESFRSCTGRGIAKEKALAVSMPRCPQICSSSLATATTGLHDSGVRGGFTDLDLKLPRLAVSETLPNYLFEFLDAQDFL
jgi:hypothetical protein